MSNLKLQILLNAVDRATKPFQSVQKASKSLSGDIRRTQDTLKQLNAQSGKIDGFRKVSGQLAVTGQQLKRAKDEAARLAIEFRNTANPTAKQTRLMEAAKLAASNLQTKHNALRVSVQRERTALESAGISTRRLSSEQRRLKASAQSTSATLDRQRQSLERLNKRQKAQADRQRSLERTQRVGDKLRNNGAVALGVGSAALYAGGRFVAPGMNFDTQMSDTRSVLGLGKDDAKMAALRQQARDIGGSTAFSPMDVARTQTVLAKSGYSADDILNSTEATVNLSLAAKVDIAQSADIVSNMQSAFDIPTKEVGRVSDVMTKAFNSSNTNLVELGEAMKYVAPIANAAGASIEDTAAMLGVLAKAGIRGSMAGTGASAAFSRLQAPRGQAPMALQELGVTTRDKKGNMLPIQKILSDIDHSFKKNKLGTAQQAEYLKVIFGEEAMKGAISLVQAAGNGELEQRRKGLVNSKGSSAAVAAVQTDNLDGDLKNMQSAFEDLQIEIFEQQDSSLRKLTSSATDWLGVVGKWVKVNPQLAGTLFQVGGGSAALITVLGILGVIIGPIVKGFGYLWASIKFLATGLWGMVKFVSKGLIKGIMLAVRNLGLLRVAFLKVGQALLWLGRAAMANPLVLLVSLLAMAAIYIWSNWETLGPKFKKLWDDIAAWTSAAWAGITKWLGDAWNSIVEGVKALPDKFSAIWQSVKDGAVLAFTSYLSWLKSFWGKVFDTVLELPGKFKAAGSAMIDALIDGISAKWEALKAKLLSLADYLPDWMKSDTHTSPVINTTSAPGLSAMPEFAGMYDAGGIISAGQVGIVGENGPELIGGPVRVTGRRDTAALLSGQPAIAPVIHVHAASGQSPQDIAREVARQIQALMRSQAASSRSAMA